ncbi:hypothetical protein PoB_003064600 [Plakobranchus ocellatus]|uniref:Uncharacterized protein n=1 Tax=Plakobranchus ocellatus TaxID=259542 RepID=A0AAV4ABW7_9GAST|nr:hypothetical protein PoB_003064600 [Plakobranchus ocellatus]
MNQLRSWLYGQRSSVSHEIDGSYPSSVPRKDFHDETAPIPGLINEQSNLKKHKTQKNENWQTSRSRPGRRGGHHTQPAGYFEADEWEVLDLDEEFELDEWLPNYNRRRNVLVDTNEFEALD